MQDQTMTLSIKPEEREIPCLLLSRKGKTKGVYFYS